MRSRPIDEPSYLEPRRHSRPRSSFDELLITAGISFVALLEFAILRRRVERELQ